MKIIERDLLLKAMDVPIKSLAGIAADVRGSRLPEEEARRIANEYRTPELMSSVEEVCAQARAYIDEIEGILIQVRSSG